MEWTAERELEVYNQIKAHYSAPEKGVGLVIEVFIDGSFKEWEYRDGAGKTQITYKLRETQAPYVVYCNFESPLYLGFVGYHQVIEEDPMTGEIVYFRDRYSEHNLDLEKVKQEYQDLLQWLQGQQSS